MKGTDSVQLTGNKHERAYYDQIDNINQSPVALRA